MEDAREVKLIHVKVIGGTHADIYDIGTALRKLRDPKIIPNYRLEAIITNENVELQDVNSLITSLLKLKKQIEQTKGLTDGKTA